MNVYCNNCGKKGHMFYNCCLPITSNGVIAFRKNPETNSIEYLMIRRKHTLGLIDFIRGKYSVYNKYYVSNMIYQMTNEEKEMLKTKDFEEIWLFVWGKPANFSNFKNEENMSKEKFNQLKTGINGQYTLADLVDASTTRWEEPEWGFPKGRRNYNETDLDCSIREFSEETGITLEKNKIINNISPFEEIFFGSNYKSYKHKYFLTYMEFENVEPVIQETNEISEIKWKSYADCIASIRSYNLEKKRMLLNIDILLKKTVLVKG
jgi:8-oxo-dGTP pyrophosphatase MutT (NUDIX family)